MKDSKVLGTGETVREGDYMRVTETNRIKVERCKYDPGCCVGHIVESHEIFYREAK